MPVNLRNAQIRVSWPTFEIQEPAEGAGVRIATTTDKTNGQVAQTKTYQYITPFGQPSGQIFKQPVHYFFSTQGRVSTRQVQSTAFNSVFSYYSHTFYLNRLSSSVTPLSSSYSGSFVNYSHVRIDYGGGANGYVDKTFFRSDTKLITSDFKDYSLPLFYNQRNGSILSEKYHSATGNLVRENRYRYNDDWGGLYSALSADSRFAPQYGYRVLSPRFTVSYALDNVPSFSRSCSEGLAGPEIFPYAETPQWHYLEDMTTREYGEDGSFTETVTEYEYEDEHFNRIEEKISGTGIEWTTKYKYAEELGSCILADHMTAMPLEIEAPNGVTYLTEYDCTYRVPARFTETYQDGSEIIRSAVTQFDPNGYPRSIARFGFTADENYTWKASPAPQGLLESKSYLTWEEEFEYNDFRQLERTIAIDEQPVEYEYDPHGRLYQIKARPEGTGSGFNILTTMSYDMGGPNIITQETAYSDAPTQTNQSYFDGLGRPTKTVINGVTKQETLYDGIGRVSASTYLPGSFTSFSYDGSPLNRLTRETYPDGNSVQFRYTAEDNEWVTTRINEREFPTKNYTDILGRQSKMEDAIGNITDHAYDGFGRLVSISSPAGSYGYNYDDRNRLISKSVPDAGTMTYCYDDATDLLCSSIDANGNRLSSEYDVYQRQTNSYLETGASTACNCNTAGELMIANQYDGFGVDQETNPIYLGKLSASQATMLGAAGQTETEFVLDEFGRVERQKDKITIDGSVVNARQVHTLNQADWLLNTQNIINGIANGASYDQAFNYDDFGRVVFENSAGVNVQMLYNDQDQMVYKLYDGGLARQDYEYNVRGWITDINILRPEVFTEEELGGIVIADPCQPLTGEDDTYVVTQQVPPAEFFELLCSGYDVTVPDVDLCPDDPGSCLTDYFDSRYENLILNPSVFYSDSRENLDFFQYAKEQCDEAGGNLCFPYGFKIKSIEDIDGNVIPLSYDYSIINTYDMEISCLDDINILTEVDELRNDLITWLDDNGYDYDEVNINVIWDNPDAPSSPVGATRAFRLQFEILGSLNFQLGEITTEYLIYCVDVEKGNIIDEYSLVKTEEAKITVTTINNCGPIGVYPSPGIIQGSDDAADFEAAIQNTNPASVTLPTKLYEVVTNDNHKLWMLEDELLGLTSPYRIHDIIYLNAAQQTFDVTKMDGQVTTTDVAGLLTQRNTEIYLSDVEPTISQGGGNGTYQGGGGTNCPPDPLGCDSATEAAQQQSLDDICAETLELFADGAISYPFSVSVVQLCNGDITYVLTDLVGDITGNHQILSTFLVDEEGLEIEVRIEEAFFAMQFDHQPNGNIEQVKWKVSNRATSIYEYSYDDIDRVTGSSYSEEYFLDETITTPQGLDYVSRTLTVDPNNRYNTTFGYSAAGNITTIWRNGVGYACGPEGQIDKMTLRYSGPAGNQLNTVEDEAPANLRQYGFRPHPSPNHGTLEYNYDLNGNMTNDPHKLLDITYNHLNLPEQVRKGSTDILTTVYDATGRKWKKTSTVDILDEYNQPSGNTYTETRVYVNGVEFSGEGTGASQIASINASSNGRVAYNYDTSTGAPAGSRVEYYHTDHLGNVRLAFSDLDGDGVITVQDIYDPTNEITQERHYYPYGLTHTGAWFATVSPEDAYRFNQKELDEATGLYDYGARYYDPAIAKFPSIDRFADKYAFQSPYAYAANNPIKFIDVNGDSIGITTIAGGGEDGRDLTTVKITGKFINRSSKEVDMANALSNLKGYFERVFGSKNVDGVDYKFELDFSVAESMDDVGDSDHLLSLVDEITNTYNVEIAGQLVTKTTAGEGVVSGIGEKAAFVDVSAFTGVYDSTIGSRGAHNASHEIGHLLGLHHRNNPLNLMKDGGALLSSGAWSTVIRDKQIRYIRDNYHRLNRGSNRTEPNARGGLGWTVRLTH